MATDSWTNVAVYSDRMSAEVALGLLIAEGLPSYVASDDYIPGLGSVFAVRVPSALHEASLAALRQGEVSEQELTDLALCQPRTDE